VALLEEEQLLVAKLRWQDVGCSRPRMLRRHRENEVLRVQGLGVDARILHGQRHDRDVDAARSQGLEQAIGLVLVHVQRKVGRLLMDGGQHRGQQVGGDRRNHADMQGTGEPGVRQGRRAKGVHRSDGVLGQRQQELSLGGDDHLAGVPLDQSHS
jgi:hypothetical protein